QLALAVQEPEVEAAASRLHRAYQVGHGRHVRQGPAEGHHRLQERRRAARHHEQAALEVHLTKGTYPFPTIVQPSHPVQMSTVTLANGLVKTVKVEEEVFDCSGRIGDVYVFTDVGELAGRNGFSSVGTTFDGVICLKDESTAKVVSCKLFTPS